MENTIKKITIELNMDPASYECTMSEIDIITEKVENKVVELIEAAYPATGYEVGHNHMGGAAVTRIVVETTNGNYDSKYDSNNTIIEDVQDIISKANAEVMDW